MSGLRLTIRELLLLVSVLTVMLYVAERKWHRIEKHPNTEFRDGDDFFPHNYSTSYNYNRHAESAYVATGSDVEMYRDIIRDRCSLQGWKIVSHKTFGEGDELVHFDVWYIQKDETVGLVTIFYANESLWPRAKLFRELESYNRIKLVTKFWVTEELSTSGSYR